MLADHFNFHPEEKENWEEFKPKRNSCVLMRVGSAHYVNPVRNGKPGCRVVITGWPFANMDWKAKFNQ